MWIFDIRKKGKVAIATTTRRRRIGAFTRDVCYTL